MFILKRLIYLNEDQWNVNKVILTNGTAANSPNTFVYCLWQIDGGWKVDNLITQKQKSESQKLSNFKLSIILNVERLSIIVLLAIVFFLVNKA